MADNVQIFLSSPGDVADERGLARQVLQSLPKEVSFAGKIHIDEISWDDPGNPVALDARFTPQEAINRKRPKPSECDVVVVILWARMGTPLPENYRKPDGTTYRSGTEWEFLDAIKSAERTDHPTVWVYRRDEDIKIGRKDPRLDEILRQGGLVDAFFKEFEGPDGSLKRSYHTYQTPTEFQRLFERHLRDWLALRLKDAAPMPQATKQSTASTAETEESLWVGNPYRGLKPFTAEHTAIFCGRGFETDELVKRVREGVPVLAVVGASGSGKSSLVAAGLLPRLAAGAIPGSQSWVQLRFTPAELGDNPFRNLGLALLPHLPGSQRTADGIAQALEREPVSIVTLAAEILADRPADAQLLLFGDQFEELFTARVQEAYQQPFVNLVEAIAASSRVRLVLSLRADYYGACTRFDGLAKLLRDGSFPLAAPTGRALAEMIEGPAKVAGMTLESGLVDDILKDVGDGPGRLALVEFAMEKLYELHRDHTLSRKDYRDELKGVSGVIQSEGDKAVQGVAESVLAEVFDALSEVDEAGGAVRRRVWIKDLSGAAKILIQRVADARLVTLDRDSGTGQAWAEVAHEAVLRSWPKFSDWLKEFRAFKLWRSGLNEARRRWLKQRDPSELLSGPRLKEALLKRRERSSWLTAEEDQFIGKSLWRHRWSVLWMGAVIAFLPLLVGGYFWWIETEKLTHTVVYRLTLAHLGFYASFEPKMVRIPPTGDCSPQQACTFQMGSPPEQCKNRASECPQHTVQFTRPFLLGQYEVSFDEWDVFRLLVERDGGCPTKDSKTGQEQQHKLGEHAIQDSGFGRGGRPVINVSWEDAQCYIHWLNGKTKPKHPYRLPTEAEWEYAARAGTTGDWFWGDDPKQAGDHAWFSGNSQNMTHPVGADKTRNPYGLYDMAGNVYEWTADCWHESYADAPKDGKAWEEAGKGDCARRVIRGGSWFYRPDYLRSANRYGDYTDFRYFYLGFRLAQDL